MKKHLFSVCCEGISFESHCSIFLKRQSMVEKRWAANAMFGVLSYLILGLSVGWSQTPPTRSGAEETAETDAASLFDAHVVNLESVTDFDVVIQNERTLSRNERPLVTVTQTYRVIYCPRTDFAVWAELVDLSPDQVKTENAFNRSAPFDSDFGRPGLTIYLYHDGQAMTWTVGLQRQTYPPTSFQQFERFGHALDLRWIGLEGFPFWSSIPQEVRDHQLLQVRTRFPSARVVATKDGTAVIRQERKIQANFDSWRKSTHVVDLRRNLILRHNKSHKYGEGEFQPKVVEAIQWKDADVAMLPAVISGEKMLSKWDAPQENSELYEFRFKWLAINQPITPKSIAFYGEPTFENLLKLVDFENAVCLTEDIKAKAKR